MCRVYACSFATLMFFALGITMMTPAARAQTGGAADVRSEEEGGSQLLYVAPRGGFGRFSETTVDQDNNLWSVGLRLGYHPNRTSRLVGEFEVGGYTRRYVQVGLGRAGDPVQSTEDELRVGGALHYGYNWLERFGLGGWTYIGWRHLSFRTDRVDADLTGPVVGGQLEVPVTRWVTLDAAVDYVYNVVSIKDVVDTTGESLTGGPLGSLRFGGGIRFNISDLTDVGVGYLGEHIPYDRSDVLYHQVVAYVGIPIRF